MRDKPKATRKPRPPAGRKFSGTLAIPLPMLREPGLLESADDFWKRLSEHRRLEDEKMVGLLASYGVAQNSDVRSGCWYYLALGLARDFVPGLKQRSVRGRKVVWSNHVSGVLVVAMEEMMEPGSPTARATKAAQVLAKLPPWNKLVAGEKNPVEALRHRYATFKNDP